MDDGSNITQRRVLGLSVRQSVSLVRYADRIDDDASAVQCSVLSAMLHCAGAADGRKGIISMEFIRADNQGRQGGARFMCSAMLQRSKRMLLMLLRPLLLMRAGSWPRSRSWPRMLVLPISVGCWTGSVFLAWQQNREREVAVESRQPSQVKAIFLRVDGAR